MSKTNYKRLGDYIREVDVRNRNLKVTKLLGVSISKEFMPSIANTIGTDMSSYKVVEPRQFAYGPVTSRNGDKVSIALYKDGEKAIVSQAYTIFEVTNKLELLPEYLMMWFRRPEFDRYARFKSHGSAREIFSWEEMCDVELPIPPIDQQQKIVAEYNAIQQRIKLNEQLIVKLEETAQAIYRKMFVDGIDKNNLPEGWRMGTLGEIAMVRSGYAFTSNMWRKSGIPVIKIGNIHNQTIIKENCDCVLTEMMDIANNYIAQKGDIVIAMTGATLGKIAIVPQDGFLVNQRVGIFDLGDNPIQRNSFLYMLLLQTEVQNEILTVGGDSAQANISSSNIECIKIPIPPTKLVNSFNTNCSTIINLIILKRQENKISIKLQSLLLAKMESKI